MGGTGKTPTTVAIYELLKKLSFKVSTAKKFYASQFDENLLLENRTKFITADNRNKILLKGIEQGEQIIIFDDGLQDKNISYDMNLFASTEKFYWKRFINTCWTFKRKNRKFK